MNKLVINYKFDVGDIAYTLHNNNLVKVCISQVYIDARGTFISTDELRKRIKESDKTNHPFFESIEYGVTQLNSNNDIVDKFGPISEHKLFKTKEEFINSIL